MCPWVGEGCVRYPAVELDGVLVDKRNSRGADDGTRMLVQFLHRESQRLGRMPVVVSRPLEIGALCQLDGSVEVAGQPEVARVAIEPDARVAAGVGGADF